jgi:tRNA threonylcarbamoyladenosine biosynthesis protein TsaB
MPQSSKRLVLDSATDNLYIGLFDGDKPLKEYYKRGHNDHSVKLMDELMKMFDELDMKVEDLSGIIVGIGPGSYTGVRIGVVVAKMLAWTKKIPLYTISSLALMSSGEKGDILSWIDARRNHAFLGLYHVSDTTIKRLDQEAYTHLDTYRETATFDREVTEGKPDMKRLLESDLLKLEKNVHNVAPVYLRQTEAERNLGK